MQVCPGCHTTLPTPHPPCPTTPTPAPASHWHPAASLAPGVVQPPYVCGRMFQVASFPVGVSSPTGTSCQVNNTNPADRCIVVPTESSCHVLCYLTCPHNCSTNAFRSTTACLTTTTTTTTTHTPFSKLPCALPELRNSLHTSGGGLMVEGEKDTSRSISPEAKVNYPVNLNPFLNTSSSSSSQQTALVNKLISDPSSSSSSSTSPHRRSPSPGEPEAVWTAAGDSRVLLATRNALEDSGWYYGALSWQQAAAMLQSTEVGTFLIRDSASPQCLYSLSVQTINGPTSVRIHYAFGKFRLDCTGHSQKLMPEFGGLVELVEHYIHSNSSQFWVDHEGNTFSPINIRKPLRRSAPSLQHLCRLAINCTFPKTSTAGLPVGLKGFLSSYPHTC